MALVWQLNDGKELGLRKGKAFEHSIAALEAGWYEAYVWADANKGPRKLTATWTVSAGSRTVTSKKDVMAGSKHIGWFAFEVPAGVTYSLSIRLSSGAILVPLPTKSCLVRYASGADRPLSRGATGSTSGSATSTALRSSSSDMVVLDNLGERSIEDWAMTDAGAWLHLTYVPTSSLESGKKDLVQRTARCSWCFKETTHTRVTKGLVQRDRWRCENCTNRTLVCRIIGCSSMARGMESWDEEACWKCRRLIKDWDEGEAKFTKVRPCSWCFETTNHVVTMDNPMNRISGAGKTYACRGCNQNTRTCNQCKTAMARDFGTRPWKCALCKGLIESWANSKENLEKQQLHDRWCSWCFEQGEHTAFDKTTTDFPIYSCEVCFKFTTKCTQCDIGMAKKSPKNNSRCAQCRAQKKLLNLTDSATGKEAQSWEELHAVKVANFDKINDEAELDRQLSRDSEQRRMAFDLGLIRPFLLLVSMHPAMRHEVGCLLGFSLVTLPGYGDPHFEAHHVLMRGKQQGLVGRASGVRENLSPTKSSVNWYKILRRAMKHGYKVTSFQSVDGATSLNACRNKAISLVPALELEYLTYMARAQWARMSEQVKQVTAQLLESPEFQALAEKLALLEIDSLEIRQMLVSAFVSAKESALRAKSEALEEDMPALELRPEDVIAQLRNQLVTGDGFNHNARKLQDGLRWARNLAIFMAFCAVLSFALASPELMLLGLKKALLVPVLGTFDGSHEVMFPAVSLIVLQRVIASTQGIDITKYY